MDGGQKRREEKGGDVRVEGNRKRDKESRRQGSRSKEKLTQSRATAPRDSTAAAH